MSATTVIFLVVGGGILVAGIASFLIIRSARRFNRELSEARAKEYRICPRNAPDWMKEEKS